MLPIHLKNNGWKPLLHAQHTCVHPPSPTPWHPEIIFISTSSIIIFLGSMNKHKMNNFSNNSCRSVFNLLKFSWVYIILMSTSSVRYVPSDSFMRDKLQKYVGCKLIVTFFFCLNVVKRLNKHSIFNKVWIFR